MSHPDYERFHIVMENWAKLTPTQQYQIVETIVKAWMIQGPQPRFHQRVILDMKDRWATMYRALSGLMTCLPIKQTTIPIDED